jgi:hypothetical protein
MRIEQIEQFLLLVYIIFNNKSCKVKFEKGQHTYQVCVYQNALVMTAANDIEIADVMTRAISIKM